MPTAAIAKAVMQTASQGITINRAEARALQARIYRLESALEQINHYAVQVNSDQHNNDPFNDSVHVLLTQIQAAQQRVAE